MLANHAIMCRYNAARRPDGASSYRGSLVMVMPVVYHKSRPCGRVARVATSYGRIRNYLIAPRAMIVNTIVKMATVSTMPSAPK